MKAIRRNYLYLVFGILFFVCTLVLVCLNLEFISANANGIEQEGVNEEKVYCAATLGDDFKDNQTSNA